MRHRSVLASIAAVLTACMPISAFAGDDATIGLLEIEGAPLEQPGPLDWLMGRSKSRTLDDYVNAIRGTANNDEIKGLVIRLKDAELSASHVDELGAAIKHLRNSGKKVHVFGESLGPTDLMLGAYADELIAQQGGPISFPGLYMEEMFLADTLGWLGLKADMVQVGDYKGASEAMARNSPSPQWEQNISQLLDSMYANMRGAIKVGRRMDDAKLDKAMREAWMTDAEEAVKLGLIDRQIDLVKLSDHLKTQYGGEVTWDDEIMGSDKPGMQMDMSNPFALMSKLMKQPDHSPKGPTIAVLHINGVIVDGDSSEGGLFGGGSSVGSRTIRNAIESIMEHDDIKGVVVRIESPGGSATASEVMWQGLRRLASKKPVWASVGGMAASGGYYVAVGTDKIYVNNSSIVGSIGVVGGKISMAGLYEKVKVKVVPRGRGPMAAMFRSTTDWSADELAAVRKKMTQTYDLFTQRVTAGRKGIDLSTTAEGRLFTGDKSIALKMADKVGGLDTAIKDMAVSVNLTDYDVMHYPGPKSIGEFIEDMFGRMSHSTMSKSSSLPDAVGVVREIVGPKAWPAIEQSLTGYLQLRNEPVLLMGPSTLIFK